MRAICPECNLEDEVDPASVTPDTRFVCARCSTRYEVFRDEAAPDDSSLCETYAMPEMTAPQNEEEAYSLPDAQNDELLILPEQPSSDNAEGQMAVLEELFLNSSSEQKEEVEKEEPVAQTEPPKVEEQRVDALQDSQSPDTTLAPEERSETANVMTPVAPRDKYAEGVRLMKVSPSRLFMGGVAFISLIVVCNLMVAPVVRTGKASGSAITKLNQDSNQSSNRAMQQSVARIESEPIKPAAYVEELQPTPTPQPRPVVAPTPAPTPEPTPAPQEVEPQPMTQDGRFTVQVGSYNEPGQAEERAAKLRASGFDARVVEAQIPNRGTWYRVQTGRFATRDEATRYGASVRAKGAADAAVVTEVQ